MNSAHGITVQNLLSHFPLVLTDDERLEAIAQVVAEQLVQRASEAKLGVLYANIDILPEVVLDILAYDFKVDWWDTSYSLEEKRKTLKDSWQVHRMMGTKAAVEMGISSIYPSTKVEEWFEYDGDPYYFRLRINAAGLRTDTERHEKVLNRVNYYKNLRSHLDGFIWDYTAEPWVNEPDIFRLIHFTQLFTFSDKRNFTFPLFDGRTLFDGEYPFGAVRKSMFGFPRLRISGSMPGVRDAVGGAGVGYSGIAFETGDRLRLGRLLLRFPAFSDRRSFPGGYFDGKKAFDGEIFFDSKPRAMFAFPRLRVTGRTPGVRDAVGGAALIKDSMYRFDGAAAFDGARRFNADITKEEL